MKKLIVIAFTLFAPMLTSACNTVEGFGQDMQKGGESVEKSADQHKHY
jgi:entericidin A